MNSNDEAGTNIGTAFFDNAAVPVGFTLHAIVGGIGAPLRVAAHPDYFEPRLFVDMTGAWPADENRRERPTAMDDLSVPLITLGRCNDTNYPAVASEFSTVVTRASLHSLRGTRRLLLHAGGIADADGRVAVLVGPSGRGKTTTIREMAREYAYVSDETIAIDARGEILPYPKPLSIIVPEQKHKQQVPSSAMGLKQLHQKPLHLGTMVILERGPLGTVGRIEPLPLAQALTQICSQSSYLMELPHPLATVARLMNFSGGFKRLIAGPIESLGALSNQLWEPIPADQWEQVLPDKEKYVHLAPKVIDALDTDDGVVILTADGQLHTLSPIASEVWRCICDSKPIEDIVDVLVGKFGRPADSTVEETLARYLDQLKALGIISNSRELDIDDGKRR